MDLPSLYICPKMESQKLFILFPSKIKGWIKKMLSKTPKNSTFLIPKEACKCFNLKNDLDIYLTKLWPGNTYYYCFGKTRHIVWYPCHSSNAMPSQHIIQQHLSLESLPRFYFLKLNHEKKILNTKYMKGPNKKIAMTLHYTDPTELVHSTVNPITQTSRKLLNTSIQQSTNFTTAIYQ